MAATQSPATPAGALAQRQWRQKAQTAVRVALTAAKEARSKFQAASDSGDSALSALCNGLLGLATLPGLRLGALGGMRPDVRAAAAAKMARQQQAAAAGMQDRVRQLEAAVAAMHGAVMSLDAVPQDEPWQRGSPVFHSMPLLRVRQLLDKVYDMYRLEYDSKAAVLAAVQDLVVETQPPAVGDGTWASGASEGDQGQAVLAAVAKREGAKRLPDLCTTYISVWMLSPYVEEEQADEALGAITEDMAGF